MTPADRTDQAAIDSAMMQRCIRLSVAGTAEGEFPFAAVICEGGLVVCETTNRVVRNGDVTQHAELLAVSKAQQVLGRKDLSSCTLYSNVEPCVMCSFPIRETRIARVVYAIGSPIMGGSVRADPRDCCRLAAARSRKDLVEMESRHLGDHQISRLFQFGARPLRTSGRHTAAARLHAQIDDAIP